VPIRYSGRGGTGAAVTAGADLLGEARARAEQVLLGNGGPYGLKAGARAYQQVWAREIGVAGLGLAVTRDGAGTALLRRSLRTLGEYQSRLGRIPHNVGEPGVADPALVFDGGVVHSGAQDDPERPLVADTAHAGCVDSTLWFLIAHYFLGRLSGDFSQVATAWEQLRRAYRWLEYQDSNECGLLEVHEAKDWADLFANRYNTLLPNVLWYAANRAMAQLAPHAGADPGPYRERSADIRFKINQLLWVGPEVDRDEQWIRANRKEWLYPTRLVDVVLQERPYYLPYMAFRDYGDRMDTLGNLLAVLFGVASQAQTDRILDYIVAAGVDEPWPIRACWPVVMPGDKDWRDYYALRNLNVPNQYHNGGCWPYIGAFYAATLVKVGRLEQAREVLERLARMNRTGRFGGDWEFNEWFHGISGRPMGFPGQSWSAGVFVFAHEALRRGRCPVFTAEAGW
jgi:glycogen debranching enzyme